MTFKIVVVFENRHARHGRVWEIEGLLEVNGQSGQCPRLGVPRSLLSVTGLGKVNYPLGVIHNIPGLRVYDYGSINSGTSQENSW